MKNQLNRNQNREEKSREGKFSSNFNARVGNTEWCLCGGNCTAMAAANECFVLENAFTKIFDKSMIECIISVILSSNGVFRSRCASGS